LNGFILNLFDRPDERRDAWRDGFSGRLASTQIGSGPPLAELWPGARTQSSNGPPITTSPLESQLHMNVRQLLIMGPTGNVTRFG
jgi:hypothetical protein